MELALHDAQSVIAREYGFASFAELRAYVEKVHPTPQTLRALMERHMSAPLPGEVQQALLAASSEEPPRGVHVTPSIPLLPLRNALLVPGAVAPLNIARAASIAAVEAAHNGAKMLAVFAQTDAANEAPTADALHPVGCAARLVSVVSTPDGGTWVVVRGTEWIRLKAIEQEQPYPVARVSRFVVQEETTEEVTRLEQALRDRVRALAAQMPDPTFLLRRIERMSALELVDAAVANLPSSVAEKARYASEPSLIARLKSAIALCDPPA